MILAMNSTKPLETSSPSLKTTKGSNSLIAVDAGWKTLTMTISPFGCYFVWSGNVMLICVYLGVGVGRSMQQIWKKPNLRRTR